MPMMARELLHLRTGEQLREEGDPKHDGLFDTAHRLLDQAEADQDRREGDMAGCALLRAGIAVQQSERAVTVAAQGEQERKFRSCVEIDIQDSSMGGFCVAPNGPHDDRSQAAER